MGWNHAAGVSVARGVRIMYDGGDELYNVHTVLGVHHHLSLHLQVSDPFFPYFSSSFLQLPHFRRIQRVGSSDQMASAAKSALICMVLLAAVMAVHGVSVSVVNQTPVSINVNGIDIAASVTAVVTVTQEASGLVLSLVNSLGKEITSSIDLPLGVTEVVLTQVVGGIQVTVGAVTTTLLSLLGGLVNSLLGLVLGIVAL